MPSPLSPTIQLANRYEALHEELGELYASACPVCLQSKGKSTEARPYALEVFERAARYIHKRKGFRASMLRDTPVRDAIAESYDILRPALQHLEHHTPETVRHALDNNAFIFSGFRTYHSLRELGLALTDKDGQIRPYEDFREDVMRLHNKYNVNYLETEYEHAVGASLMADRWWEAQQSGDSYHLQYRTAGDSRVRPDHEALEGITLPKSDKFWADYFPPNGWRCRCDVVEVSPSDYPLSDSTEARERGNDTLRKGKQEVFRGNPGKDLVLFPDRHPYYGRKGIAHCSTAQHASGDGEGDACGVLAEIVQAREIAELKDKAKEQIRKVKHDMPEHNGVQHSGDEYQTGIMIMLRRSLKDIFEHSQNDPAVLRWLTDYTPEKMPEVKYLGWGDPKHKHNDTSVFTYYEVKLSGEVRYLNAKVHKWLGNMEVVYTIESTPPTNYFKGDLPPEKKK